MEKLNRFTKDLTTPDVLRTTYEQYATSPNARNTNARNIIGRGKAGALLRLIQMVKDEVDRTISSLSTYISTIHQRLTSLDQIEIPNPHGAIIYLADLNKMLDTIVEIINSEYNEATETELLDHIIEVQSMHIAFMRDSYWYPNAAAQPTPPWWKLWGKKNIVAQDGGGSRTTTEKPKWVSTGRKVTIQKRGSPAAQKTVFRNSVTKELRVRKATLSKDGTRRFAYVKF
jgi:hypothetical protein